MSYIYRDYCNTAVLFHQRQLLAYLLFLKKVNVVMETDWRLCPSLSISKLIHLNLTLRDVRWSLKVTPVRRPLDWAGVSDTNYHFVLHPENNVNNRLTDTMDGFVLQCTHRHSTDCYVDTRLFHLHQSNVHFQTPSNVCHFLECFFCFLKFWWIFISGENPRASQRGLSSGARSPGLHYCCHLAAPLATVSVTVYLLVFHMSHLGLM